MNEKRKHPAAMGERINGIWVERPLTKEEMAESDKSYEEMDFRFGRSKRVVKKLIDSGVYQVSPEIREEYSRLTFPPPSENK